MPIIEVNYQNKSILKVQYNSVLYTVDFTVMFVFTFGGRKNASHFGTGCC